MCVYVCVCKGGGGEGGGGLNLKKKNVFIGMTHNVSPDQIYLNN